MAVQALLGIHVCQPRVRYEGQPVPTWHAQVLLDMFVIPESAMKDNLYLTMFVSPPQKRTTCTHLATYVISI